MGVQKRNVKSNRLAIGNSPLKFWNLTRALWCERKPPSFFLSTLCPSLLLTYTILQFLFKTFNQLAEPPMSKCMNYPWCMYAEIVMSEPLKVIVTMFKFNGSNQLSQTYIWIVNTLSWSSWEQKLMLLVRLKTPKVPLRHLSSSKHARRYTYLYFGSLDQYYLINPKL